MPLLPACSSALTAQFLAQSMEDAYDLAYRLSRSGEGEWAQQIEEYEKQRIPRTLRIRREAAQNERVFMSYVHCTCV